jgi:hypothetical protein
MEEVMFDRYVLVDGKPVYEPDFMKWALWMEDFNHIAMNTFGEVQVSTVFLGTDHSYPQGNPTNPILFETMVFGGPLDQEQERYSTMEEALAGHERYCALVKYELA